MFWKKCQKNVNIEKKWIFFVIFTLLFYLNRIRMQGIAVISKSKHDLTQNTLTQNL